MKNYDDQIEKIVDSLNIPDKDRDLMIASIYQDLKLRVGMRLAEELSDEELAKLMPLFNEDNQEEALMRISHMAPNLDQIIDEELAIIAKDFQTL